MGGKKGPHGTWTPATEYAGGKGDRGGLILAADDGRPEGPAAEDAPEWSA